MEEKEKKRGGISLRLFFPPAFSLPAGRGFFLRRGMSAEAEGKKLRLKSPGENLHRIGLPHGGKAVVDRRQGKKQHIRWKKEMV